MQKNVTIADISKSVKEGERREKLFKRRFSRRLKPLYGDNIKFIKEKSYSDIDFMLNIDGEDVLGVEFKERNIASYDYPDFMIRERKIAASRKMLKSKGIHSIVVMRFLKDNQELFFDMRDWESIKNVTRRDRRSTDIHIFYNINDAHRFDETGMDYIQRLIGETNGNKRKES